MILFNNLTHCKKNSTSRPKHVKFPDVFSPTDAYPVPVVLQADSVGEARRRKWHL